MKKPIRVIMTFSNPILIRAIKEIIGNNDSFIVSETAFSSISCDEVEDIDVILCETEMLERLEKEHVCLAPITLGISIWNNMISISKGDLQSYDHLDEIIHSIQRIAEESKVLIKCESCSFESKRAINNS